MTPTQAVRGAVARLTGALRRAGRSARAVAARTAARCVRAPVATARRVVQAVAAGGPVAAARSLEAAARVLLPTRPARRTPPDDPKRERHRDGSVWSSNVGRQARGLGLRFEGATTRPSSGWPIGRGPHSRAQAI